MCWLEKLFLLSKLFEEKGGVVYTIDRFVCFSIYELQTASEIVRNSAQDNREMFMWVVVAKIFCMS